MTSSEDSTDPDPPTSTGATDELLKRLAAHGIRAPRYKLEGEIARGGMGAILRVWDEDVRRHLAMKVILGKAESDGEQGTPQVDSRTLARFLEEGQVTGQLDHPGIVPVHELGLDADGRVYFTMKLVKGRDLRQIFELVFAGHEGWTQTRALGVVLKACEALAYAHKKGVIHRDLKPANVMVGNFGEVYVMDWGLARVLDRKDTHDIRLAPEFTSGLTSVHSERSEERDDAPDSPLVTMDGDVMGTPAYMPPEQARGEIEKLSPRSDVYSIGAVLYHLLARQLPYVPPGVRMTSRTVLARLLEGPPRPLHELRRDVPAELAAICEKAMAREAERRYPDTLALAEDLRAYLEGRVVHAYETGAVAELRKWVARNQGMAAASAAALLVAIGGLAWVSLVQSQARKAIGDKNLELVASERLARWQSYVANIAAADASVRAHEMAEAKRRLAACDAEQRGWEWRRVELATDTSLAVLRGHTNGVWSVAYSPDGTRVASASADTTVRLWNLASGECQLVLNGHEGIARSVAFSPDGTRLASGAGDSTVRVWDMATGQCLLVLTGHEAAVQTVAFSPDGTRIASGSVDGNLRVWDPRSGAALLTIPQDSLEICTSIAFSPDGSRIASGYFSGTLCVFDASSGERIRSVGNGVSAVYSLAFAPDGSRIATGSQDGTVRLWGADSLAELLVFRGHEGLVKCVAFSPDGSRMASSSVDSTLRVFDVSGDGASVVLHGHEEPVESLAFSPDGSRIASGSWDGTVRIWNSSADQDALTMREPDLFLPSVAFSPDGTRLASASGEKLLRTWNATSGEALLVLRAEPELPDMVDFAGTSVAYSPDGARLVWTWPDRWVRVCDAVNGVELLLLDGHKASVSCAVFSPDGTRIASASMDKTLRLWDAANGEPLLVLRGHADGVFSVAFNFDGTRIASGSRDKTARVWSLTSGDGQLVLQGHEDHVCSLAFSPDGARIASASRDKTVRIWDGQSGACLLVLRGHGDAVHSVAFSPDGTRIASASQDKTVRVWDSGTGESLLVLRGHRDSVHAVTFSADGTRIATASGDTTVRVWETSASVAQEPSRQSVATAAGLVPRLFEPLALVEDVVQRLQADASLSDEVRATAIRLAHLRGNDPIELNTASWNAVRLPNGSPAAYERAARAAGVASELRPRDGLILNTLGVAEYRVGRFQDALETLKRSDVLNGHKQPGDAAFLAMVNHRLGHASEAQAELKRLREFLADPGWSGNPEAQGFLAEAEAVIRGSK